MAASRVCLFAHYDPAGRVRPHVLAYLTELRACGFAVHLALSGVEAATDEDRAALVAIGVQAHPRPNRGLDFGAWRDLMRMGLADGAERVLLANDSVFGPFAPLAPILERMEARGLDAWGMVESRELGWHLQSWFLQLSGEALARPTVRRVFDQPFEAMSKAEIVLHGELGLGTALRLEGLSCGAFAPDLTRGLAWWLLPVNPMHFSWRTLLDRGVPFLKADLLRDNPSGVPWAPRWRQVLAARFPDYPLAWIHEALWAYRGTAPEAPLPYSTPIPPLTWGEALYRLVLTSDRAEAVSALASRLAPPGRKTA